MKPPIIVINRIDAYEPDEPADLENTPYCECDLEPYEEESASNVCSACGKLLS